MITFGLKNGPTKDELIVSFESFSQSNRNSVTFITDDGAHFVGFVSGLKYDEKSGDAFDFSGFFEGKLLHGYYHTKTKKGWIETDLNDLSIIQQIKALLEKSEKIRTKNYLLLCYRELIDVKTAISLSRNNLVRLPTSEELREILSEISKEAFDSFVPKGYLILNKTDTTTEKSDSKWAFLTEDNLNGKTRCTMYGVLRGTNGEIESCSTIDIDDSPTLGAAIFIFIR